MGFGGEGDRRGIGMNGWVGESLGVGQDVAGVSYGRKSECCGGKSESCGGKSKVAGVSCGGKSESSGVNYVLGSIGLPMLAFAQGSEV